MKSYGFVSKSEYETMSVEYCIGKGIEYPGKFSR